MTMEQSGDVRARFEKKIRECFEAYQEQWLKKRPDALIEAAEEIASIQRMAKELPGAVTEETAGYLLQFKNPLQVVSDRWRDASDPELHTDDSLSYVLWQLYDRRDAEADYELEPKPTPTPKASRKPRSHGGKER